MRAPQMVFRFFGFLMKFRSVIFEAGWIDLQVRVEIHACSCLGRSLMTELASMY
jgi:hypothetical protein